MSEERNPVAPPSTSAPELDPWRFGWRYVPQQQPDGTVVREQVPLTYEDVLHPQEGDVIVETPVHDQTCLDLKCALQLKLAGRLGFVVLHSCRVDWGVPGVRAHAPDIAVMENVGEWDQNRGTFYVAELGARPVLVIEVTSPSTRTQDIVTKMSHYYRAGVPFYAIMDRGPTGEELSPLLLGYRATPAGYAWVDPDEHGRLPLPLMSLSLGVVGGQLVVYDERGKRMASYVEVALRLEHEAQRAESEARRAEAEAKRADDAARRADAAEAAREQLEAKVRELEARIQASGS